MNDRIVVSNNPENAIDPIGLNTIVLPRLLIPRITIPRIAPNFPLDPVFLPPFYYDIDMRDTSKWPQPPVYGSCTEGEPSRKKPRNGERKVFMIKMEANGGRI